MKNECFFAKAGEKGMTETSVSHLCALAAQLRTESEKVLENVGFINTDINIVGSNGPSIRSKIGMSLEDMKNLQFHLERIAELNSLISWFAEARTALEFYKSERRAISIKEWCDMNNITMPVVPVYDYATKHHRTTFKEVEEMMSIKEKQLYLELEATASVYGKFIHNASPMEQARKELHQKVAAPYDTQGEGRDTIIKHYTSSVDPEEVDKLFISLQTKYRKIEQQLNHMKSDICTKLDGIWREEEAAERLDLAKHKADEAEFNSRYQQITVDYNQWRQEEESRLSKIKFAIPEALKPLVDKLNNIDSQLG